MSNIKDLIKQDFPGIPEKDISEYLKDDIRNYNLDDSISLKNIDLVSQLEEVTIVSKKYYPDQKYIIKVYIPEHAKDTEQYQILFVLDGTSFLQDDITPFSFPALPTIDSLVKENKIPPTICIFIDPSIEGPGYPIYGGKGNRSVEYDTCSPDYGCFLINEIIPELKRSLNLKNNFKNMAIMGASSGGSAAFGVCWYHTEYFNKVLTSIGSFVNIRGSDKYIDFVRKSEKKDLKIYIQDGSNDLNTIFGNWTIANENLASSLSYKNYNYFFNQGNGGHNYFALSEIFDKALIWLLND
ncbi:alpha/beta hydrolase [Acinetobacter pittii]|uniref:alpha/beta hydrolase n=1 Tax=Acinetobacter pittii TaxID=48296 RepID=UPI002A010C35|nr:alpha/beta hydrolase-fold protein [Acinetobacter pittii]MDX8255670.1 alpha/beta hydrolase-fold protein [Acinetobacter pittii]